jgi:peroxiredoxin
MKVLKNLLHSLLLLCFSGSLYATPDSVILSGRFVEKLNDGVEFKCRIIKQGAPIEQVMFNESFSTKITNGQFRLSLPAKYEWFNAVFSLAVGDKNIQLNPQNIRETTYLLHTGDVLDMLFRPDGLIDFSGKGSGRLSCQQNIYSLGIQPEGAQSAYNELFNKNKYQEAYDLLKKIMTIQMELKRTILETYRDSISEPIRNLIWSDIIGQTYGTCYYSLYITSRSKNQSLRRAGNNFFNQLDTTMPVINDDSAALHSPYYTNSLRLKEMNRISYQLPEDSLRRLNFGEMVKTISKNYKNAIKDRLLFLCFLNLTNYNEFDPRFIDQASAAMSDDESKDMLNIWARSITENSPAYPFSLPDEQGKMISLKELRGKVVVADFWFLGCHGCTQIPSAMATVYEKYRSNGKVVFLSINIDSQKKWWDYGLKTGLYAIPGSKHLSLYGAGKSHPMLKFYNYDSFPQLLIINQDGKTVSAYPPDPRIDQGAGLIKVIDTLL